MRVEPFWHESRNPTSMSIASNSLMNNGYTSYENIDRNPSDLNHQKRGRSQEQRQSGNFSLEEGFTEHNNSFRQQYPGTQHRRARSADSRPQYNNRMNIEAFPNFSSARKTSSYREGLGFSSTTSQRNSNRALSDVGVEGGSNSFNFYQLPRYEAVIHDDSILYSSSKQRTIISNAITAEAEKKQSSKDFLALSNKSPTGTMRQTLRSNDQRMDYIDHRQLSAIRKPMNSVMNDYHQPDNHHHQSLNERERQYYNYAKENLITFGSCDAPTASTGLSQEELLQRKRREEVRNKRKEKRRSKNRIVNFPSNLLRGGNQFSTHNQHQTLSSSPNYQKMEKSLPHEDRRHVENIYGSNSNNPNSDGNANTDKIIRGSMSRRQRNMKSLNHTSRANGVENNHGVDHLHDANVYETTQQIFLGTHDDSTKSGYREAIEGTFNSTENFDSIIRNPNLMSRDVKTHDHISKQVNLNESNRIENIPYTRATHIRPTYAEFTPRSDYSIRHSFFPSDQAYIQNTSPTSIIDAHLRNPGGVRWNENLTQQLYIFTPQSTKLRPDSDIVRSKNYAGKPKSILRSRGSSSYMPKNQIEEGSSECSSNKYPERYNLIPTENDFINNIVSRVKAVENAPDFHSMNGFVDGSGRSLSPIGIDRLAGTNGKFPESYVHFIEAVASVVIQTKVRQKLAKNKVEAMQKELHGRKKFRRFSEAKIIPKVRKSYVRETTVRRENEKLKARRDAALDFYALAAIQIQAAFRGWWVRDCLGVDNYCATLIQKTYRGSCCRKGFLDILNHVIHVQSICRRWIAIDGAVTRMYCIVRIQAIMRGSLVRKRMKFESFENDVFNAASVIIQTAWRSFWCEMHFLRTYEDILVVQSIVRGWIARRFYRLCVEAKNSEFSGRRITHTPSKNSKFMFKSRKDVSSTYYNHADSKRKTLRLERKSGMSQSQQTTYQGVSKPISLKRNKLLSMKDRSEVSKSEEHIQRKKKMSSPWNIRDETFQTNNLRTQEVTSHGHGIVSTSRADIEKRRKNKEEEFKVQKEEERRRLDLQAAEVAEIESRRKKMAMKAEARKKEKAINKETRELTKSVNVSDMFSHRSAKDKISDSSQRNEVALKPRESFHYTLTKGKKPSYKFESVKISKGKTNYEAGDGQKVDKDSISSIPNLYPDGKKSLVMKRGQDMKIANGDCRSFTKNGIVASKISTQRHQSKVESELREGMTLTMKPKSDFVDIHRTGEVDQSLSHPAQKVSRSKNENGTPKRISTSSAAYHKEMRTSRSDSEQRRIDAIHHTFEQAGLLFRMK